MPGDAAHLATVLPLGSDAPCTLCWPPLRSPRCACQPAAAARGSARRARRRRTRARRGRQRTHAAGQPGGARRPGRGLLGAVAVPGTARHRCHHAAATRTRAAGVAAGGVPGRRRAGARARHLRSPLDHARVRRQRRRASRARRAARAARGRLARRCGTGRPAARHLLPSRAAGARRPSSARSMSSRPIPAIALFGILMAPLGALAAAVSLRGAARASAASARRRRWWRCSCTRCCRSSPTPCSGLKRVSRTAVEAAPRHGHDDRPGADRGSSCRWRCR